MQCLLPCDEPALLGESVVCAINPADATSAAAAAATAAAAAAAAATTAAVAATAAAATTTAATIIPTLLGTAEAAR
jgi:hypothetical protein